MMNPASVSGETFWHPHRKDLNGISRRCRVAWKQNHALNVVDPLQSSRALSLATPGKCISDDRLASLTSRPKFSGSVSVWFNVSKPQGGLRLQPASGLKAFKVKRCSISRDSMRHQQCPLDASGTS